MRELGLVGGPAEGGSGFDDIDAAAERCRFRDCSHEDEPGCAVRTAVEVGEIDADRLASFHRQRRERQWLNEKLVGADHEKRKREKQFARVVDGVKALKRRRRS